VFRIRSDPFKIYSDPDLAYASAYHVNKLKIINHLIRYLSVSFVQLRGVLNIVLVNNR
jgi:hypothetical protein